MTGIQIIQSAQADSYIRVVSLSIALYDYLLTLPAEWRLYKSQKSVFRLSVGCMLFIAIRYISIFLLIISNYGFFAMSFDAKSCGNYYLLPPIFKVVQTMVSQLILGLRTYNVSGRKEWVKWTMIIAYIAFVSMEWFTNLYQRHPISAGTSEGQSTGNCAAGNSHISLSAWLYYVLSMVYDLICITISTIFLLTANTRNRRLARILRIIFYDGLGYFIILSVINIFNIILYKTSDSTFQSSGTSLGYSITWICSQRLLIHLREIVLESQSDNIIFSQSLRSRKAISKALRSPFRIDNKPPPNIRGLHDYPTTAPTELDVHVRVEQTVSVEHDDHSGEWKREEQWKPKSTWDSKS